jgi:arginine deiminase
MGLTGRIYQQWSHLSKGRFRIITFSTKESLSYGVLSEVGQLRKVMVCAPGLAHTRLTPTNCDALLFDDVLWVENAKRDHFDFITKMRDRGVEVAAMRDLLAETLNNSKAKKWILDQQITPNEVGVELIDEIRSFLESLPSRKLAETLIGGLSTYDVPALRPTKIYPQRMTTLSEGAVLERADLPTGTYVAFLYYR